jgi:hypothetical protein
LPGDDLGAAELGAGFAEAAGEEALLDRVVCEQLGFVADHPGAGAVQAAGEFGASAGR